MYPPSLFGSTGVLSTLIPFKTYLTQHDYYERHTNTILVPVFVSSIVLRSTGRKTPFNTVVVYNSKIVRVKTSYFYVRAATGSKVIC